MKFLGKSQAEMPWTKVPCEEAAVGGAEVTIFVDRRFLIKALRFGLSHIEISDDLSPLRISNGGRQMIIMPVRQNPTGATSAPKPPTPAVPEAALTNPPLPTEQPKPSQPMPSTNGHHHSDTDNGASTVPSKDAEARPALETALVQIEGIKTAFRESIAALTKLGDSIRQALREQKAGDKDLQNVRQTLRSLQSVRI